MAEKSAAYNQVAGRIIKELGPGVLDGFFPHSPAHTAAAGELLKGKTNEEQLKLVLSAQFDAMAATAHYQILEETYHKLNPQPEPPHELPPQKSRIKPS